MTTSRERDYIEHILNPLKTVTAHENANVCRVLPSTIQFSWQRKTNDIFACLKQETHLILSLRNLICFMCKVWFRNGAYIAIREVCIYLHNVRKFLDIAWSVINGAKVVERFTTLKFALLPRV